MKPNLCVLVLISTLVLTAAMSEADATEQVISTGTFRGGPHAPADTATGRATLVRLDNGKYELRLGDDFESVKGPDLVIYLSAAEDPKDDTAVAESPFVNAGELKALSGSQSYELPVDFDPAKFNSVNVWCKQFSVLFATAPLTGQPM